MKQIKHKQLPIDRWGWIDSNLCPCHDRYAHYLWMAAPEIQWLYVEEVGSYQGEVYAIGKYKRQWFVMQDYYGSCSGCGAWGEGGEPDDLNDVLRHGELFKTRVKALEYANRWLNEYESPSEDFYIVLGKSQ